LTKIFLLGDATASPASQLLRHRYWDYSTPYSKSSWPVLMQTLVGMLEFHESLSCCLILKNILQSKLVLLRWWFS